jgi:hypothetical protein
MAKTILTTSRGNFAATGITTAGGTQYWKLANTALFSSTSEATQEIPYQTPGTFSKLYVRIIANSTSAPSTLMVRKNRVDTAMTIPIPAGYVGELQDSANLVAIVAGDKMDYRTISGGTGTFTMSLISLIFDATTNCVTKFAFPHVNVNAASASGYIPLSGTRSGSASTEASIEHILKAAGTFKNAYLFVTANPRTTATSITLRKNRTGTAITFSYAAAETGAKEDTTNLIPYAVDDKVTWQQTTGAGTENLAITHTIEYETATGHGFITAGSAGATGDITVGPGVTEYYTVGGAAIEGIASEADAQMKVRERFTFSLLTLYARANTITAPSTFTLRKNGADTAMSVTIGASTVGYIVDDIHSVDFEPDDLICYKLVTGGTGTLLTIEQMAVWTLPMIAPVIGGGGGAVVGSGQGRPPQYRETRPRDISIAIIRIRIPLEYEVEKLSVQVPLPYTFVPEKKLIKYASAILTPLARILPLPIKPTPPPVQIKIVRLSIPLSYEVTNLQLKAACSYEVDRLFTQEQQHKIVATSINFLLSDF